MKKYILLASILGMLGLSSCGDVLDIYPVENNTTDQFYSNEYEMQQAVIIIRKTKKPFFQNEIEKSNRENTKTKTFGFPTRTQKNNSV